MELIIGLGIVAFLLLFFVYIIRDIDEHFALRLLALFFFLLVMLLIPKVAIDTNSNCDWLTINTTQLIEGNTTTTLYGSDYVCEDKTTNTPNIFYKIVIGFIGIFYLYIVLYFIWKWMASKRLVKG